MFAFLDAPYSQGAPYLITDKGAAPLSLSHSHRYIALGSAWQYARGYLDAYLHQPEDNLIGRLFLEASKAVSNVSLEYQTVQYRPDGKSGAAAW